MACLPIQRSPTSPASVTRSTGLIRRSGAGYTVLLDAAAFVPTSPLSLREVRPDFVALSIYKISGYPTGVGALICRHEALRALVRPSFAGGTVEFVSVTERSP